MNMLREDLQLQVQFTKVTAPPLALQATPTPKRVAMEKEAAEHTVTSPSRLS